MTSEAPPRTDEHEGSASLVQCLIAPPPAGRRNLTRLVRIWKGQVSRAAWVAAATVLAGAAGFVTSADAQSAAGRGASVVPDITGAWERVGPGALAGGQGTDVRTPPPVPAPPLKMAYLGEWRARQQAAREATAKGQPIGINWVNCLPDGMPGMMQGPFPMEILQTRGQVTIIQESFTQIRRILLIVRKRRSTKWTRASTATPSADGAATR